MSAQLEHASAMNAAQPEPACAAAPASATPQTHNITLLDVTMQAPARTDSMRAEKLKLNAERLEKRNAAHAQWQEFVQQHGGDIDHVRWNQHATAAHAIGSRYHSSS
jgi:hypothetical protein